MARKTKEAASVTKELIFKAATSVFFEKGVGASSLDDIAKQAGVTRGAIYWHFKNKLELFKELHIQTHREIREILLKAFAEDETSLSNFQKILAKILKETMVDENFKKILTIFLLRAEYSGEMGEIALIYNESSKDVIRIFKEYFDKLQKNKLIKAELDTYLIALSFHCYISGVVMEFLRCPARINLSQDSRKFINIFFRGFVE